MRKIQQKKYASPVHQMLLGLLMIEERGRVAEKLYAPAYQEMFCFSILVKPTYLYCKLLKFILMPVQYIDIV